MIKCNHKIKMIVTKIVFAPLEEKFFFWYETFTSHQHKINQKQTNVGIDIFVVISHTLQQASPYLQHCQMLSDGPSAV